MKITTLLDKIKIYYKKSYKKKDNEKIDKCCEKTPKKIPSLLLITTYFSWSTQNRIQVSNFSNENVTMVDNLS